MVFKKKKKKKVITRGDVINLMVRDLHDSQKK